MSKEKVVGYQQDLDLSSPRFSKLGGCQNFSVYTYSYGNKKPVGVIIKSIYRFSLDKTG
ncbi:MAG: hypothetical protein JNN15_03645 [Blastocatellia bacterium]|nr:hypothetical protein [Blastocatellia bacterium]